MPVATKKKNNNKKRRETLFEVERQMENMIEEAVKGVQPALTKYTGYVFTDGEHESLFEFFYKLFAKYRPTIKERILRERKNDS